MYIDAAASFELSEKLDPGRFRYFGRLARCYLWLDRPEVVLQVCERWNALFPRSADLYFLRGLALRKLGQLKEGHNALLNAITLSPRAFEAVESLLLPLAAHKDATRLLALCDELPDVYASSTVMRGYRAIGLSRVGRTDEARTLMDLERQVAQVRFEPPAGFGGIEDFNSLLAEEILGNPDLRYMPSYGFHRTEHLNVPGALAFPILATFLRATMERYFEEVKLRRLDAIFLDVPKRVHLISAGNVVRMTECHRAHLHKFAVISGVYHVSVPPDAKIAGDRAGALVVGSCDGIAGEHAPCWGTRDIKPIPGVATIFPSHIFHSVVPTCSEVARIAVPFDLCVAGEA
jgi:hypothetical protein